MDEKPTPKPTLDAFMEKLRANPRCIVIADDDEGFIFPAHPSQAPKRDDTATETAKDAPPAPRR
jgi:hypothetical protein